MDIRQFIITDAPRSIFLAAVGLAAILGSIIGIGELRDLEAKRKTVPFAFYGDIFNGLSPALKGEKYLGYFTDKNIAEPKYGAQVEQAQLALAPLILDLNSTSRRFTLFDCLDPNACLKKIQDIKARPLKMTNQGIIFTIKE